MPAMAAACAVGSRSVSCPSNPRAGAVSFAARQCSCSTLQCVEISLSCCQIPRAPQNTLSTQPPRPQSGVGTTGSCLWSKGRGGICLPSAPQGQERVLCGRCFNCIVIMLSK